MEDFYLVQKAKKGDRQALDALVRKYYSPIYYYVLCHMKRRDVAEDITQEIFMKMVKALPGFLPIARFSTFLYRIAHNTMIDGMKRTSDFQQWDAADVPDHSDPIRHAEDKMFVDAMLEKLPEEQRVCITLYYLHGFKYREIAELLAVPEATVKTRVRRGIALCRKYADAEERKN